jgi:hypothetical protein
MNFRATPALKKQGVTRDKHIAYHLEGYLVRTTSVFDRRLILTNDVFRLGNPPRNCRRDVILSNSYVKNSVVAKSLTLMEKVVDQFKQARHAVAHRAGYSDEELYRLGIFYLVTRERPETAPKYKHVISLYTNRYMQSKASGLRAFGSELNAVVALLMNSLAPHFETQYQAVTGSRPK